eukprot:scaffold13325_cov90-Isochrysis_galbana.AAC.1
MLARNLYLLLAAAGAEGALLGRAALAGPAMASAATRRAAAPLMAEDADPEKIAKALKAMTGFANSYCAQRSRRPPTGRGPALLCACGATVTCCPQSNAVRSLGLVFGLGEP